MAGLPAAASRMRWRTSVLSAARPMKLRVREPAALYPTTPE